MVYTYANDFAAFVKARDAGDIIEIDEEMFGYWLDVLPPVYMNRWITLRNGERVHATFGFAEGWEPITAFWVKRGPEEPIGKARYFCQRTSEMHRGG